MAAATQEMQHHTSTGVDNRKLLMWVFLASECLFFGSLISAFLIFKERMLLPPFPHPREITQAMFDTLAEGSAVQEACAKTLANGMHECHGILDIPVTSASTFVLLMSSLTMVLAVYGAQHGRPGMMKAMLLGTIVLGLTFIGFQVYEFRTFGSEGLNLTTNQFGATFFVLTGFHGTHVGVGVLYLASLLLGSFRRNGLGSEAPLWVDTAGLYWHFVDIVWIVIFTVIYLIPS